MIKSVIPIILFSVLEMLTGSSPGKSNSQGRGTFLGVGCYSRKQLRDVRLMSISSSKINVTLPLRTYTNSPEWCSENRILVPKYLRSQEPQATTPPYTLDVNSLSQTEAFLIRLKSSSTSTFNEAIIVAKSMNKREMMRMGNIGRFVLSDNTELICCAQSDKDVIRFKSESGVKEALFYWLPYEEVTNDFEGNFLFKATVIKSKLEYWTNITSNTMNFVSRFWQ